MVLFFMPANLSQVASLSDFHSALFSVTTDRFRSTLPFPPPGTVTPQWKRCRQLSAVDEADRSGLKYFPLTREEASHLEPPVKLQPLIQTAIEFLYRHIIFLLYNPTQQAIPGTGNFPYFSRTLRSIAFVKLD